MSGDTQEGCIFCVKAGEDRDEENGILYRGGACFVMLNAYPYNPGHLMVIPYAHESSLEQVPDEAADELMHVTRLAIGVLREAMAPDGLNIGINQGRVAGAGIADHVHQHIVPRWAGDTNFMTSIGQTKVLPEMLQQTYEKLAPLFVAARKASSP